jgi:hypothetical protein
LRSLRNGCSRISGISSCVSGTTKYAKTYEPLTFAMRFSTMPSGYLINESASWTVIVVGEIAGYPCWCKIGTEGGLQHHSTHLLRRGKNQGAPSEDYTFFHYYRYLHLYLYYYCSQLFYFYYYEAESKLGSRNSRLLFRSSLLIYCSPPFNYKDPPIYIGMG